MLELLNWYIHFTWILQCLTVLQRLDVWLSGGNDLCVWNQKLDLLCKTHHLSDTGKHIKAIVNHNWRTVKDVIFKETFHEYKGQCRWFFFSILNITCNHISPIQVKGCVKYISIPTGKEKTSLWLPLSF